MHLPTWLVRFSLLMEAEKFSPFPPENRSWVGGEAAPTPVHASRGITGFAVVGFCIFTCTFVHISSSIEVLWVLGDVLFIFHCVSSAWSSAWYKTVFNNLPSKYNKPNYIWII